MSNYAGGRRHPNVSQYVADLNTIPSAQDVSSRNQDTFGLDDDMSLFTNTEFFDFDLGEMTGMSQPAEFDSPTDERMRRQQASSYTTSPSSATFTKPDFQFPDFPFQPPTLSDSNQVDIKAAQLQSQQSSPSATSPITHGNGLHAGDKRKLEYMGDPNSAAVMEDASRMAADEDKRRRNTAASARFRIKKKQREQALEKTAKEMTDKVGALETRVQQLEMENKWLKGLITEKNDKTDISEMFKHFTQDLEKTRIKEERKDGVGTTK